MAANMLPIMMMSSMASSCSSSVSSPAVMAFFFWTRVAAFFGSLMKGLNPFSAVGNVGKKIGRGLTKAGTAISKSAKKTGRAISRSAKKTGRALKKAFKIKKIRIKRPRWCFSPETPIKLQNGETVLIKNLKLGDILINDSVVDAVMTIRNTEDPYYTIYDPELKQDIYVTGSHYVKHEHKYIQVMHLPDAKPTTTIDPVVNCLVTSDHKIPVGSRTFWDWEDNLVPTLKNVDTLINKIRVKRSMKRPNQKLIMV